MLKMPNLADIGTQLAYRYTKAEQINTRIGIGFMDKSHWVQQNEMNRMHDSFSLVYLLQGRGEYSDETGYQRALKAGDYFLRVPGIRHSSYVDLSEPWREVFVDLGMQVWQPLVEMGLLKVEDKVRRVGFQEQMVEQMWALLQSLKSAIGYELKLIFNEMLTLVFRLQELELTNELSNSQKTLVLKACGFLETTSGKEVQLQDFCQKNGVGYEKFRKIFKKELGMSPSQYRTQRKIEKASAMLCETKLSVAMIAEKLHYSSPYEFSNQFKKFTGITPKKFRSQNMGI